MCHPLISKQKKQHDHYIGGGNRMLPVHQYFKMYKSTTIQI